MPEQKIELERIYTVPLSRAWITARHKRTKRAVKILREFAAKHMKSEEIKIDTELNERLWNRGITRPPRRITVKMEKDEDGVVTISLPEEKVEEKLETEMKEEAPKEELPSPTPAAETEKEKEPVKAETEKKETTEKGEPKKEAPKKKTPKKETKNPAKKKSTKAKSKK